ncbi:unnamed protein product [Lactuca saligna]|uniref:Uncharacterized protein n=1 Tax=Lactuca saligna TaxID=75948 RepID=A0AA35VG48_LACSI|nr:unnamed protein product [Lactuca saligna]
MIKQLCDVWFGTYKLFASSPRFQKEGTKQPKKQIVSKIVDHPIHTFHVPSPVKSYISIVKGTALENCSKTQMEEIIDLSSRDFVMEKGKCACLVKAIDFLTLPNLYMLCLEERFQDFDMKYVDGLWVLIGFKSKHACL